MARLWTSGFENQSVTAGHEWETLTGAPTINTTIRHGDGNHGLASLRVNPSATTANLRHQIASAAVTSTTWYGRAYIYVVAAPGSTVPFFEFTSGTTGLVQIRMGSDRHLELWAGSPLAKQGNSSTILQPNQWYCIELKAVASAGAVATDGEARINGEAFATFTGQTGGSPQSIRVGMSSSATCDIYYDDIALNDSSGSFQTSYPGSGFVAHLVPNATGTSAQWRNAAGGGTNNYEEVDETTPDDVTSYVDTNGISINSVDSYNISATPTGMDYASTINCVSIGARMARSGASTSDVFNVQWTAGGNTDSGSNLQPNSTTWVNNATAAPRLYTLTSYDMPGASTTAITKASLDAAEIGIKATTVANANDARVSKLWMVVDYLPSTYVESIHAASLATAQSSAGVTSLATGSITIGTNHLALGYAVSRTASGDPNHATASGGGLTWVEVGSVNFDNAGSQKRLTVLRAMGTPSAGAITFDFAGQTQTDIVCGVVDLQGVDTTGANGFGAVVQYITNADTGGAATTLTATLADAFSATDNATIGFLGIGNTGTLTPGTGFATTGTNATAANITGAAEFKESNDTTVDMTFSVAGEIGIVAVEVRSAVRSATKIATLTDNFDDNSLDATKWVSATASSATAAETGAKIVLTPAASTVGSTSSITSLNAFSLVGSQVLVEVPQVADTTNVYTNFYMQSDSNNYVGIGIGAGNLEYIQNVAGSFSAPYTVAYNSTNHRWWRIRESNGFMYTDYSADGITWTNFYTVANPISVVGVFAVMSVYEHTSTGTPSATQFNNFNLGTSGSAITSLTDNFNDNSIDTALWVTYTAGGASIAETGQQLAYTLAATTSGSWAGVYSKAQYNLTGTRVYAKFPAATTGNDWFDLTLSMEQLPVVDNFFSIGVDAGRGMLQAIVEKGGLDTTLTEVAYNSTTHAWLALRESSGTIYWEYSSDGSSWSTLYSQTAFPEIPLTNLYVVLDDYEYDGASSPAVHNIDNFNTSGVITVDPVISGSLGTPLYPVWKTGVPNGIADFTSLVTAAGESVSFPNYGYLGKGVEVVQNNSASDEVSVRIENAHNSTPAAKRFEHYFKIKAGSAFTGEIAIDHLWADSAGSAYFHDQVEVRLVPVSVASGYNANLKLTEGWGSTTNTGSSTLDVGIWNKVTVSLGASNVKAYVNRTEAAEATVSHASLANLSIGAIASGKFYAQGLNGSLLLDNFALRAAPTGAASTVGGMLTDNYDGWMQRYLAFEGGIIRPLDEGNDDTPNYAAKPDIVSEGQAYGMLLAVQHNDKDTFDLIENFNRNFMERTNYPSANASLRAQGAHLMGYHYNAHNSNVSGPNSMYDWNFATDADIDRAKALMYAWNRWGRTSGASIDYLARAQEVLSDLKTWGHNSVNGVRYMGADYFALGDTTAETNVSYFDLTTFRLARQMFSDQFWSQSDEGMYEIIRKSTSSTGSLMTNWGLPPNWINWNTTGLTAQLPNAGRDTKYSYDAFRTVYRMYLDYDLYQEKQARDLLSGQLYISFASEYSRSGQIQAEYNHDGSVAGAYEGSMFYAVDMFPFFVAGATAAGASIYQGKVLVSYRSHPAGSYWSDSAASTGGTPKYFQDSWIQLAAGAKEKFYRHWGSWRDTASQLW